MISDRDLGWAAGFLEGEGSFMFRRYVWTDGYARCGADVVAPQVQREPLDRLRALFGGRISLERPRRPECQPQWRWTLTGPKAIGLMFTLYAIMSPRRRTQIASVIEKWKALPGIGGRGRLKTHCLRGHPFTEANTLRYRRSRPRWRGCRTCANDRRRIAA